MFTTALFLRGRCGLLAADLRHSSAGASEAASRVLLSPAWSASLGDWAPQNLPS